MNIDLSQIHVGKQTRMTIHTAPAVHAAIRAGMARISMIVPMSARGIAPDWAIDLEEDEAIVATAPVTMTDIDGEPSGVAALIVKRDALPRAVLDPASWERAAHALVGLLRAKENE
jgi:hypothetical protein